MAPIYAATIVLLLFAIGEWVSFKTKAGLSSILVTSILLIVGFWVGLPKDILVITGFGKAAATLYSVTMVNMATMVDLEEIKKQWKTFIIGFIAVCFIVAFIVFIGPLVIDKDLAIAGAPVVAGGMPAFIVIKEAAIKAGFDKAAIFGLLILLTQTLIGVPISSFLLKKQARQFVSTGEWKTFAKENAENNRIEKKKLFKPMPKDMQKPVVLLAKGAIVAAIAQYISHLTGGFLNGMMLALIIGIIAFQLGFIEKEFFQKSNGFGLMMFMVLVYCFGMLPQVTPEILLSLVIPWVVAFGLGLVGIFISSLITSKLVKMPLNMTVVIGLTALYGFPGTYIVSNEVATAIGETDEEKQALLDYFLPKMLIAGFATMTISSVLIVGFVANMF
ncbi:MAG: hypothetical protein N4A68_20095 [Maledivibacter sp.]|jgi:hypothetical protein|nr:hypothetical protein [Maledivibacter sp.]